MTPVAVTAQAVRRIPRGAQRYSDAQLPPPHVGAPFMTPGAGTAQVVRHVPRGTGWLTVVVSDDTGRQTGNPGRLTEILK